MATRSLIFCQTGQDMFVGTYCHFDGYICHTGKMLFENYNSKEKLLDLFSHGSLISIAEDIDACEFHRNAGIEEYGQIEVHSVLEMHNKFEDSDAKFLYMLDLNGEFAALQKTYYKGVCSIKGGTLNKEMLEFMNL